MIIYERSDQVSGFETDAFKFIYCIKFGSDSGKLLSSLESLNSGETTQIRGSFTLFLQSDFLRCAGAASTTLTHIIYINISILCVNKILTVIPGLQSLSRFPVLFA